MTILPDSFHKIFLVAVGPGRFGAPAINLARKCLSMRAERQMDLCTRYSAFNNSREQDGLG